MIGNRIKLLREEFNLKQEDLAKKIDVSPSAIGMYERDLREPNDELTLKLAEFFGVTTDYLLGKSNNRNDKSDQMENLTRFLLSIDDPKKFESELEKYFKNHPEEECIDSKFYLTMLYYAKKNIDKKDDFIESKHREQVHSLWNTISDNLKRDTEYKTKSAVVLVYGTIPAGIPMEMIEDVIDTEEIDAEMLKGGKEYFGLRIKGNSMYPEYLDGDTIILEKVDNVENGTDAVVMVNGDDGTFKRVFKNESGIVLQPLNPQFQPIVYTNEQIEKLPIKVIGKVVELRRKK